LALAPNKNAWLGDLPILKKLPEKCQPDIQLPAMPKSATQPVLNRGAD
jgi:hypothetical protein